MKVAGGMVQILRSLKVLEFIPLSCAEIGLLVELVAQ
jgi:hypothetical protein